MLPGRLLPFFAGMVFAAGATPAAAATLTVNTSQDETTAGDGQCSLREAIAAVDSPGSANGDCAPAAFGANTIVLSPGSYPLGLGSVTPKAELTVVPTVTSLTIVGAGEGKTTIDGSALGDRVLQIAAGATVTISSLTITGGHAPDGAAGATGAADLSGGAGSAGANGGAISNQGTLTLLDAAVTNSRAGSGGDGGSANPMGIGNPGANGGDGGAGGEGGAIFNTGTLTLTGATIATSHAGGGGDGGRGEQGQPLGGTGGAGGAGGAGGGVANEGGALTITASTIRGNAAGAGGSGGGGGPFDNGMSSSGGPGGKGGMASDGGGVWSDHGVLSIANSTIVSNTVGDGGGGGTGGIGGTGATGGPGGDGGSAGGLAVAAPGDIKLLSLTVVGNASGQGGTGGSGGTGTTVGAAGANGTPGTVGGIAGEASSVLPLQDSLLALNAGGNCGPASISDGGHNLSYGTGDSSCPVSFSSGNPNLGPLQDNGGPSVTISLQPDSAAIDKVPPAGAGCPATDQRGVPRPSGPACDIGAYELAAPKAVTLAATAVGTTGATVNGAVTPNAGDSTVQFEFGKSTKYGSLTAVQHVAGVASTLVSAKLTGLKANTIYHYRVLVTAMDGAVKGTDRTFNTTPPPLLRNLAIRPASFRAGGRGAAVSYTDSEASSVTFTVLRAEAGVRRGKACFAPPRHGPATHKCTRFVKVGGFTKAGHTRRNSFRFSGRLGRRALARGSYRLDATPRANRLTGTTVSATFEIT